MNAYTVGQAVELKGGTRGSIVQIYRASDRGAQRDMAFYLFRNGINGTEFTVGHTEIARASTPAAAPTQPTPCQQQQAKAASAPQFASFNVSRDESRIISEIARRAVAIAHSERVDYNIMDCEMDVTACHANGNPLKLAELAGAKEGDFVHDVFGIRRHINRETGELENCFSPRYSA